MKTKIDPVTRYARAAVRGHVIVGRLVRLACERHLDDLKFGHARGLYFDVAAANRAIAFFRFLRHSKGEWAGERFELRPWQAFIVGSIFGWKREDGTRRFTKAFIEVARKNGKSTLLAGIGLYLLVADGEPGAEIYTAATKRDQARITHSEATRMVRQSPGLLDLVRVYRDNLSVEKTSSKYEPLGADANTTDGLNPSAALIDEVHAHRTREMFDVLDKGTGARRQPLVFEITTAGLGGESLYNEHHDYSEEVLEGAIRADEWFAYVATIDEGDDWTSLRAWKKANPNLGVSVKVGHLREECARAKALPAEQNAFLRFLLDVRTQQVIRWLSLDVWDRNAGIIQEEILQGRECYGGLDLGWSEDLTAWALAFPDADDPEIVGFLLRFWCPEARLYDRSNRYAEQYRTWARQGVLKTTPGAAVDYDMVREDILRDAERFAIGDLGIDRWNAHQIATQLEAEGLTVAGVGQGFRDMSEPAKELERRLLRGKIRHGGNPLLRWQAAAAAIAEDPAGNIKVMKPKRESKAAKVDGLVAAIMALGRLMRHEEAVPQVIAIGGS